MTPEPMRRREKRVPRDSSSPCAREDVRPQVHTRCERAFPVVRGVATNIELHIRLQMGAVKHDQLAW